MFSWNKPSLTPDQQDIARKSGVPEENIPQLCYPAQVDLFKAGMPIKDAVRCGNVQFQAFQAGVPIQQVALFEYDTQIRALKFVPIEQALKLPGDQLQALEAGMPMNYAAMIDNCFQVYAYEKGISAKNSLK